MCNCKKEITAQVYKHLTEEKKGTYDIGEVVLKNEGLVMQGHRMTICTYDIYEATVKYIKKSGEKGPAKKLPVPVYHTYCPHCGKKRGEE